MVYINLRAIGSGFVLGVIAALTLLLIATLCFDHNRLECSPKCSSDAIAAISDSLQSAKIPGFMVYTSLCLDGGESIDNVSVKQNANVSLIAFRCGGSICSNNGTLTVTEPLILARSNSVFRTTTQCYLMAGVYTCTIDVIDR